MIIEHASGKIVETHKATRNGQPIGKIHGLITTFVPSRPFDNRNLPKRFERTAFEETIQNHRDRDNRPIRLLLEHADLIGGFPIADVHVNSDGLFATGEINLNTQLGAETFALAQQGILTDLSMGYSVTSEHQEGEDRIADSVEIFEASITQEPANQGAKITSLESLTPRELERALIMTGKFTRSMCKELAAMLSAHTDVAAEPDHKQTEQQDHARALISSLNELKNSI